MRTSTLSDLLEGLQVKDYYEDQGKERQLFWLNRLLKLSQFPFTNIALHPYFYQMYVSLNQKFSRQNIFGNHFLEIHSPLHCASFGTF